MPKISQIIFFLFVSLTSVAQGKKMSVKDSLELVLKKATDTNRVILLNKLSFQYMLISSHEKALSYSDQAFKLSDQLDYEKGKAKSLINTGNVYLAQSEFEKAKGYYLQALDIARKIKNYLIISHSTNNLGEVFREQANYEKALSYYLESLRAAENLSDKQGAAETLNNIGLIHQELRNFKKAIECFDQALKVSTELNNKYDISTNLVNLATAYADMGNADKSLGYYQQALEIKREINAREGIAIALNGIGNNYRKKKDFAKALDFYQQALDEALAINDKGTAAWCFNNMGIVYAEQKEYSKSIEYIKKFLEMSTEIGTKEDMRAAYANLAANYALLKDFKTAYRYQNLFADLNDSLFNAESSKQIANMQVKYESEKKEKEIESLKKEQALQVKISRNQMMLLGGVAIIVFMGGMVFYFRAQANKQKNIRLNEKLDAQNRELSTIAMLVSKKNNALNQLKEKLEKISREGSGSENVNAVLKDIGSEIAFDEEWDTFKYHFEKVHPDFFSRLKQAAPNLSVTELRLCAYLKSNLTTKEISQLTNTTVRSVQQAKYRINQKFKESNTNVSEYLVNL